MVGPALVAALKEVFRLKNLRCVDGKAGRFARLEHDLGGGVSGRVYLDSNAKESSLPRSLRIWFDEEGEGEDAVAEKFEHVKGGGVSETGREMGEV